MLRKLLFLMKFKLKFTFRNIFCVKICTKRNFTINLRKISLKLEIDIMHYVLLSGKLAFS
ncbi:hypothetical protein EEK90_04435 [Muribaculaceae bacterium Isolate-036 (Harlan)]|nr:hypothetical protein EEK90_04435 [Muribaculaceae bacterium Isolate-036 (Harlan)]